MRKMSAKNSKINILIPVSFQLKIQSYIMQNPNCIITRSGVVREALAQYLLQEENGT